MRALWGAAGAAGSGPEIGPGPVADWRALAARGFQLPGREITVKSWDNFLGLERSSGTKSDRVHLSGLEQKKKKRFLVSMRMMVPEGGRRRAGSCLEAGCSDTVIVCSALQGQGHFADRQEAAQSVRRHDTAPCPPQPRSFISTGADSGWSLVCGALGVYQPSPRRARKCQ